MCANIKAVNFIQRATDIGKFKTPSGFVFNKDPNDPLSPQTSKILLPLSLTSKEKKALEAFLHSITSAPAAGPHKTFIVQELNEV